MKNFQRPLNLNIKTFFFYRKRWDALIILLMFSRGSQTTSSFTKNSAKFAILCFLSEAARAARWDKAFWNWLPLRLADQRSQIAFKVNTFKPTFEENILPCTLFSWFPTRLKLVRTCLFQEPLTSQNNDEPKGLQCFPRFVNICKHPLPFWSLRFCVQLT